MSHDADNLHPKLKPVVDTIDDVLEPLRAFYLEGEHDGKFHLQVDAMVPKAKLDEFRATNIELGKGQKQLEEQINQWRQLSDDPSKLAEEVTELRKLRQRFQDQELVDKKGFEAALEKRTAEMRTATEGQIKTLVTRAETAEHERDEWRNKYRRTVVDRAIQDAALSNGVLPNAIADVLERARRDGWTLSDKDKIVRIVDGEVAFGADGASPLSPKEWVLGALKDGAPYFFERAGGGGAGGLGAGGISNNPFMKESWNLTQQGMLVRDKPALAKALAQQAGIRLDL